MEDREIIALFQSRKEDAIAAAKEKYGAYCNAIAERITGSSEDAEEILNDLWLHVWNNIPPQDPQYLRSFLAKITRNLAFDCYRKENAGKRGGAETDLALMELEACIPGGQSPEAEVMFGQLQHAVTTFIDTLSQRDGNVFLRRYFYVDSTSNIAQLYGLKESNVLTILSRTRKKLKNYLSKEGYF